MTLLTRCPACATWFKVVPDQLRVSQGWVKCGRCNDIFDGRESLCELDLEAVDPTLTAPVDDATGQPLSADRADLDQAPTQAPSPPPAPVTDPAPLQASPGQPAVGALAQAAEPALEPSDALLAHITPALEPSFAPPLDDADAAALSPLGPPPLEAAALLTQPGWNAPPADASAQAVTPALGDFAADAPPAPATWVAQDALADSDAHALATADALYPGSQQGRAQALPLPDAAVFAFQRPAHAWRKRALLGAIVLSSLALVGQVAWFERSRWAADPDWREPLHQLCAQLGCRIDDWASPQDLMLEGVSLQRQPDGTLLLRALLRNASPRWLALPALELSLTDTQDAALIRRVWQAQEWAQAASPLPPLGQRELNWTLRLNEASPTAFVGYRLLAFYP